MYYDLHIHTALSPCADDEMTPNNIVNMAHLKGLDIIAVTDHNSIKNVEAVSVAAKKQGITVIPGMEVETAEEVHIITLFPSMRSAYSVWQIVDDNMPFIENNPDIFGEQFVLDENDNIIEEESKLLLRATKISVQKLFSLTKSVGGIAIPAHINRRSNSLISNLGFIPPELNVTTVEVSGNICLTDYLSQNPYLRNYNIISNSDAHSLGIISERNKFIDVINNKPQSIIGFFG